MIFSSSWWNFYIHTKAGTKDGIVNICSEKSAETTAEKVCLCLLLLYLGKSSEHSHTKELSWTLHFTDYAISGHVCCADSLRATDRTNKRKTENKLASQISVSL